MLEIKISDDIENRLHVIAQRMGKSEGYLAWDAVLRFIEDMEDIETANEVLANPGKRWTLEEVENELGLEN